MAARALSWTPSTGARLEARLRRRRSRARAKQLWVDAVGLLDSHRREERAAGRDLLRRLIADHPGEVLDLGWAHALLGDACEHDGLVDEARRHYRRSDELERDPNGPYSGSDLRLAELIVRADDEDDEQLAEADGILDRLEHAETRRLTGTGHRYRFTVARARLCARLGRDEEAAAYAVAALRLSRGIAVPAPGGYESIPSRGDAGVMLEMHDLIDTARS
jgi:tetratricopeptide (TPR) repeat protein